MILSIALGRPVNANITIGQGPAIGVDKRNKRWYQEFQDWTAADVRALAPNGDEYRFTDDSAFDSSRDLIAFYSREETTNYYFRTDFFDLASGANTNHVFVYVAIHCAAGGSTNLPDGIKTVTDMPWQLCVKLYSSSKPAIQDMNGNTLNSSNSIASYWSTSIDSVEFAIRQSALQTYGWTPGTPITFQVYTTRGVNTSGGVYHIAGSDIVDTIGSTLTRDTGSGSGLLSGSISSAATVNQAKLAVIAHGNQSVGAWDPAIPGFGRTATENLIYVDSNIVADAGTAVSGYVRTLDTHQMFNVPLNLHMSGTLISSLLWARQNPKETGMGGYPTRDGPALLNRIKTLVQSNVCSIIGGVYSESLMPYFEGDVNRESIAAYNDLAQTVFGLTTNDMKVLHTPERVMHSNTNWFKADPRQPLQGQSFQDVLAGGYIATVLDEVTHLHWWFYPDEATPGCLYPGYEDAIWTTNFPAYWAGYLGTSEARYQHKIHKINGVYTFMINDREDAVKFHNADGGMYTDARATLLGKALSSDPDQITVLFDDWEAISGNSFGSGYNSNADNWHNTIRWAANHQWIAMVNLKDVVSMAQTDSNWVVDHGYVYDKSMQTYEWLLRATGHSYDHWYYGYSNTTTSVFQENFFAHVPKTAPTGSALPGTKAYGDMNTPGTLLRDSWDKVAAMPAGNLKTLAQWTYYAMIYETAWHDVNPPSWWTGRDWNSAYHSCNYQATFNNPATGSYENSNANDPCSDWLVCKQGHVRSAGILADAAQWVQDVKNGIQGATTVVRQKDVDDDLYNEYVLRNNRVYLCFKRWGGRLVAAFVYDPVTHDATEVIGQPVANPAQESDEEDADNTRCSGFKDRWAHELPSHNTQYVDMDYATNSVTGEQATIGSNYVQFVSYDGKIRKRITLPNARDAVQAKYTIDSSLGTLYIRHGLGPNQLDLLHHGDTNLVVHTDSSRFYGLTNKMGSAVYAVRGMNNTLNIITNLPHAGYQNRELPLVEEVEVYNTGAATNFNTWLAFSPASANDIDGDGLLSAAEAALGTDPENPDTDGDGMPDGWEVANGLHPLNPSNASQPHTLPFTHRLSNLQVYQNRSVLIADNDSTYGVGTPDWWRATYFGTTTTNSQSCAPCDPDGDGFNNLQEQPAETTPNAATLPLRIQGVTPALDGGYTVTW